MKPLPKIAKSPYQVGDKVLYCNLEFLVFRVTEDGNSWKFDLSLPRKDGKMPKRGISIRYNIALDNPNLRDVSI